MHCRHNPGRACLVGVKEHGIGRRTVSFGVAAGERLPVGSAGSFWLEAKDSDMSRSRCRLACGALVVPALALGLGGRATAGPPSIHSGGPVSDAATLRCTPKHYRVRAGDTLSAIARRFEVSVEELAAENGLDPRAVLPVGLDLAIPIRVAQSRPRPSKRRRPGAARLQQHSTTRLQHGECHAHGPASSSSTSPRTPSSTDSTRTHRSNPPRPRSCRSRPQLSSVLGADSEPRPMCSVREGWSVPRGAAA